MSESVVLSVKNRQLLLKNILRRSMLSEGDPNFIGWQRLKGKKDYYWKSDAVGVPGNRNFFQIENRKFLEFRLFVLDEKSYDGTYLTCIASGTIPLLRFVGADYRYLFKIAKLINKIDNNKSEKAGRTVGENIIKSIVIDDIHL